MHLNNDEIDDWQTGNRMREHSRLELSLTDRVRHHNAVYTWIYGLEVYGRE